MTYDEEFQDEEFRMAVLEHARTLGMDPVKDEQFLWLAEEALLADLPDGWDAVMDESQQRMYYINHITGESTWENPLDETYRRQFLRLKISNNTSSRNKALVPEEYNAGNNGNDFVDERKYYEAPNNAYNASYEQYPNMQATPPVAPSQYSTDYYGEEQMQNGQYYGNGLSDTEKNLRRGYEEKLRKVRDDMKELKHEYEMKISALQNQIYEIGADHQTTLKQNEAAFLSEKAALERTIEALESQDADVALREEYESKIALLNEQIVKATEEQQKAVEASNKAFQAEKAKLERQLADVEKTKALLESELDEVKSQRSQDAGKSVAAKMGMQNKIKTLEKSVEDLEIENAQLKQSLNSQSVETEGKIMDQKDLERERSLRIEREESLRKASEELANFKAELEAETARATEQQKKLQSDISGINRERDALQATCRELEKQLEDKVNSVDETTHDALKESNREIQNQLDISKAKLAEMENEAFEKNTRLVNISEELESQQRQSNRLQHEVELLKSTREKLKNELDKEMASSEKLEKSLHETTEQLRVSERQLKSQQAKHQEIIEERQRIAETLRAELEASKTQCQELQARVEACATQMKGDSSASLDASLRAKEEIIAKLQGQLSEALNKISRIASESEASSSIIGELRQTAIEADDKLAAQQTLVMQLQEKLGILERNIKRLESDKEMLATSLETVKSELSESLDMNHTLRSKNTSLQVSLEKLERDLKNKALETEEVLRRDIGRLENDLQDKDARNENNQKILAKVRDELTAVEAKSRERARELELSVSREMELERIHAKTKAELDDLYQKYNAISASRNAQATEQLEASESQYAEMVETANRAKRRVEELELELARKQHNFDQVKKSADLELETRQTQIASLERTLETLRTSSKEQITKFASTLENKEQELDLAEKKNRELEYEVRMLKGSVSKSNTVTEELEREHSRVIELQARENELEIKIKHLEREIKGSTLERERAVSTHADDVHKLQEMVSNLRQQNESLQTRAQDMESTMKVAATAQTTEELRKSEEQNSTLLKKNGELQLSVDRMTAELANAKENAMKVCQDAHNQQVRELHSEIERLKRCAGEMDFYRNKVDELVRSAEISESRITTLQTRINDEVNLRRKLHNKIVDLQGNIRVFCRVRPILPHEVGSGKGANVVEIPVPGEILLKQSALSRDQEDSFEFDQVFESNSTQTQVYQEVEPLVVSALDGYNVCIFAYGQTGSGKTHTMDGHETDRGVNLRTFHSLFEGIKARIEKENAIYTVQISILEIYNESIRDLLADVDEKKLGASKKLEVRQSEFGLYVPGLVLETASGVEDIERLMTRGSRNRTVASHNVNSRSSRSHLVVTATIVGQFPSKNGRESAKTYRSKLNLIDLAGSERLTKTEATGTVLEEAKSINKSLSALGNVMQALGKSNGAQTHVPFRDSKLTYLLQDSLNGSSRVLMFVNISPAEWNASESLCSLSFASRCRKIALGTAKKNTESGQVAALKRMVDDLQAKLARAGE